jgi:hypothetical protein
MEDRNLPDLPWPVDRWLICLPGPGLGHPDLHHHGGHDDYADLDRELPVLVDFLLKIAGTPKTS